MAGKINPKDAKLLAKFEKADADDKDKWIHEIELLGTRVQTNFKDIPIDDNGGTIAIKASLSDRDMGEIAKLDQKRSKIGKIDEKGNPILTEKEIEEVNEIAWEVLGMVTANPLMTEEWFANNREKYSTEDMMTVSLGYYDNIAERARRASEIQQFRNKPARH